MKDLFVKICGITRTEDALLAASLGASAIGFIFFPESKRFIHSSKASVIAENLREVGVSRVGVFVNPRIEDLDATIRAVSLDHLQFHGHESATFISEVKKRFPNHKIIKAIRLETKEQFTEFETDYTLLDPVSAEWGGTGKTVPWAMAQTYVDGHKNQAVLLAGGITPDNVLQAIQTVRPFGIDLSSGVENAPGIKSTEKLEKLFSQLGRGIT